MASNPSLRVSANEVPSLTPEEIDGVLLSTKDGKIGNTQYTIGKERLRSNAFRIRFDKTRFYRYTLHFEPKSFKLTKKEEGKLASLFLEKVKMSDRGETVVFGNRFEVFTPSPEITLETRELRVVLTRSITRADGAFKSFLQETPKESEIQRPAVKIWTTLDMAILEKRSGKTRHQDAYNGTERHAQVIYFVTAKGEECDDTFMEKVFKDQDPRRLKAHGSDVNVLIRLIDGALKRQAIVAHETAMKQRKLRLDLPAVVAGNKIFDFTTEPNVPEPWLEVRKGVAVDTRIIDDGIARFTAPVVQVFLKDMNLADIYEFAVTRHGLDRSDLQRMLMGLKIRKTYNDGTQRETLQITGIGEFLPCRTAFERGNAGLINVEEYFKEKHVDISKSRHQYCIVVGSLDNPQYLPPCVCWVLPGQFLKWPHWKSLQDHVGKVSKAYLQSFPDMNDTSTRQLMDVSTSQETLSRFGLSIERKESFTNPRELQCIKLTKKHLTRPSLGSKDVPVKVALLVIRKDRISTKLQDGPFRTSLEDRFTLHSSNIEDLPIRPNIGVAEFREFLKGIKSSFVLAIWVDKVRFPAYNRELKRYCDSGDKHLVSIAVENIDRQAELGPEASNNAGRGCSRESICDTNNDARSRPRKDPEKLIKHSFWKAQAKIESKEPLGSERSDTLLVGIHVARVPTTGQGKSQDSPKKGSRETDSQSNHSVVSTQRRETSVVTDLGSSIPSPASISASTMSFSAPKVLRTPFMIKAAENNLKHSWLAISVVSKLAGVEGFYRATMHYVKWCKGTDIANFLEEHKSTHDVDMSGKKIVIYRSGIPPKGAEHLKDNHGHSEEDPGASKEECKGSEEMVDAYEQEHRQLSNLFEGELAPAEVIYITVGESKKTWLRGLADELLVNKMSKSSKAQQAEGKAKEGRTKENGKGNAGVATIEPVISAEAGPSRPKGTEPHQDSSGKIYSSVIAFPGVLHTDTRSWLMQKGQHNDGTGHPVLLTLRARYPVSTEAKVNEQLAEAFEASWDHSTGDPNAKMLAPVHYARLAARRALAYNMVTVSDEGEVAFEEVKVHRNMKKSLYYI